MVFFVCIVKEIRYDRICHPKLLQLKYKIQEVAVMDDIYTYLVCPKYWLKRILLIGLYCIHICTGCDAVRTLKDMFHLSGGLYPDMVVVATFLVVAIWCLNDDRKIAKKLIENLGKTFDEIAEMFRD